MRKDHPTQVQYENLAKAMLRKRMRVLDVSYKDLSRMLRERGVTCSYRSLINKVSSGGFSASFLLLCLDLLGVRLPPID